MHINFNSYVGYVSIRVRTDHIRTVRLHLESAAVYATVRNGYSIKEALYIIWCGVNRLGDSGANRLGDTSAFVNTAGQLLLTRRGKTRMDGVGIVFEFYTAPL